jgi:hypothetical protein
MAEKTYTVSCHCGRIKYEVTGELNEVTDCNCSICSRAGYLHWYVEATQVKLLTPQPSMSTYVWRKLSTYHHFCPVCGNAVLRSMVSPNRTNRLSVNVRCIEGLDLSTLNIKPLDGKNLLP